MKFVMFFGHVSKLR